MVRWYDWFEVRLSFAFLVSAFIHLVILVAIISPEVNNLMRTEQIRHDTNLFSGRDIIVNINQNGQRVIDNNTLLSDKDSSASGFITKEKGGRWLNNSLEFVLKRGGGARSFDSANVSSKKGKLLLAKESDASVNVVARETNRDAMGDYSDGSSDMSKIPDKNDFSKKNALFFSNDGRFSFNTLKFKDFEYIRAMKNRISMNWHVPMLANSVIYGPAGYVRVKAITNQEVRLYFIMNRSGEVLKVQIVDSLGFEPLDKACTDSIWLSKNFGKVPDDMKGHVVVIPFIFGYYVE